MKLLENPSIRLLKHIVRCYLRLSEHAKARDALRQCLPDALRDQTLANVFRSEESVQRWHLQMLKNLSTTGGTDVGSSGLASGGGGSGGVSSQLLSGAAPATHAALSGLSGMPGVPGMGLGGGGGVLPNMPPRALPGTSNAFQGGQPGWN